MMQINVGLMVATVDFLRSINGKEVVLNTEVDATGMANLLIYPKEKIFVRGIDDLFKDCEYDVLGFTDVEFGFDEKNPFKYQLGTYIHDSSPIVLNNDLMFDLINEVMEHKGFVDLGNQDDFILSKTMLYQINNIGAIITINDSDLVGIEDVEIFDFDGEDKFIDWINNQHEFIIQKLRSNANTWQSLLDDLKDKQAILCPQSALELAQIKFEYEDTKKSLHQCKDKITIPKDDLHKINQLLNGGIVMLNEITNVDFNNGGNLGVFIESMAKEIPIDIEMVNVNDNMIGLDFHQYQDKI